MRKYVIPWNAFLITGIIILLAIDAGAVPTAFIQEQEPNDKFETAQLISDGDIDGKVEGGESDFYRIEANTTDAVDIEIKNEDAGLVLRLYDSDREELVEADNIGTSTPRIVHKLSKTGTYYIEVDGPGSQTTTSYTLDFDKITPSENDDFAPNDDFSSASPITKQFIDAKIWGGESDFYRIEANKTDAVDVEIENEDASLVLRLYDSNREELIEADNIGTSTPRIVHKLPKTGTYYIEVDGPGSQTTTSYTLDFDKITPSENDDFAPNDDFSSAAPITKQFTDAKIWGGESDFYRIEADTTDAVDIEIENEDAGLILRLYDSDREELVEADNIGTSTPRINHKLPENGTYYIEVDGPGSQTTTSYTLRSNLRGVPASDSSPSDTDVAPGTDTPFQTTSKPPSTQTPSSSTGRVTPDPGNRTGEPNGIFESSEDSTPAWVIILTVVGSVCSIFAFLFRRSLIEICQDLK